MPVTPTGISPPGASEKSPARQRWGPRSEFRKPVRGERPVSFLLIRDRSRKAFQFPAHGMSFNLAVMPGPSFAHRVSSSLASGNISISNTPEMVNSERVAQAATSE